MARKIKTMTITNGTCDGLEQEFAAWVQAHNPYAAVRIADTMDHGVEYVNHGEFEPLASGVDLWDEFCRVRTATLASMHL